ncbi:MAG: TrkA family potassium uptake protein [Chloroflexi bacterium]|nr:TrkA family potassium uptake protein [Chloroflexota bacterium]
MAQQVVIAGLGQFGTVLARTLAQLGYDVLAVDRRPEPVRELADIVGSTVQGDTTSPGLWNDLPVKGADTGVVAFGSSMEANVMTTLLLRRLGVKKVIARSDSEFQSELLRAVGVDQVVEPWKESAQRLAHTLGSPIEGYIEMTQDFGVAKVTLAGLPKGVTVRRLYDERGVTVLALRRGDRVVLEPRDDEEVKEDDILIVAGKDENLRALPAVV